MMVSTDIDTDFAWLFSDGGSPVNLSNGHDGYQPTIIFSGETYEFYYYSGGQTTVTRLAVTIDGQTKAARVV